MDYLSIGLLICISLLVYAVEDFLLMKLMVVPEIDFLNVFRLAESEIVNTLKISPGNKPPTTTDKKGIFFISFFYFIVLVKKYLEL